MSPTVGERLWTALFGALLANRLVVAVLAGLMVLAGLVVMPFDPGLPGLPRDPVSVDALPDIGENQQIVFTSWPGRSPRDVEDQVTYPLTTALLGIPGVQTVRSTSAQGFSTLYVLFDDHVDFYWARSRVLEKLASLPPDTVPADATPTLGPDATALGQIYWYTLQGQDAAGNVVGGWDPDELRSLQDWTVRFALSAVDGVSEVASVGGFVREYQIDVDPDALRASGVTLAQVVRAVQGANLDVGARTLEINRVEYLVRGLGFVEDLDDLAQTVVVAREGTPIRVRDVARVALGPALRRGALDDAGAPAVGGVVVARPSANPRAVIAGIERAIAELEPGLPKRTLADGTEAQVRIVPFYDRTVLVDETLDTLSTALGQQVVITLVVVLVLLRRTGSALLVAALPPLGVLGTFGIMRLCGVDANLMALGGIAIAIGSMVDTAIVLVENIDQHLSRTPADPEQAVVTGAAEVAPAVATSILTTVVGFLPVFGLTAVELRYFGPLALTKTFAMGAALVLGLVLLPVGAWAVHRIPRGRSSRLGPVLRILIVGAAVGWLASSWAPLGPGPGRLANVLAVGAVLAGVLGAFIAFERAYPSLLAWVLANRGVFLVLPALIVVVGIGSFDRLGRGHLPPFDEGAFLYMPTTMPHASMGEVQRMLSTMDAAIAQIPEVDRVVGKLGRAESALDPAPVSMIETLVTLHPEYATDPDGRVVRQWREHIRSPSDVWDAIAAAADLPGLTGAPLLMPIQARIVMLQSGMRAPLGVKVKGPSLEAIEAFGVGLEEVLRDVPSIRRETVFADRVVGKPYLEIDLDREAIGRFGLTIGDVQGVLQVALGGRTLTRTVEGRERYDVRVRYLREMRDSVEALDRLLVPTPTGEVPLSQLATVRYARGPQVIRAEDTFLTSHVLFDRRPGHDTVAVVEDAEAAIAEAIAAGSLVVPDGVRYAFAGTYAQQLRSEARLRVLIPVALALVFVLLQLQFRRVSTVLIVGSGVLVAASGGVLVLALLGTIDVTIAVWVGLIALMGIATDDGVVMATYLRARFARTHPTTVEEVRAETLAAGVRRIRPCLMTTATTLLALLPVVTSHGRGADVMVPLAVPMLGGMAIALITVFVVPALWCAVEERALASPGQP